MKSIIALMLFPCFCGSNPLLLSENIWKTVANYSNPKNEKKILGIHQSFSRISSVYDDVSEEIIQKLGVDPYCPMPYKKVAWRFFEHSKSGKLFAENINKEDHHLPQLYDVLERTMHYNIPHLSEVLIQTVIESDIGINSKILTDDGRTFLTMAAANNQLDIGRILIDAGADVRAKDGIRWTALEYAVQDCNIEFVRILMDAGVDVQAKGGFGMTPLERSLRSGNHEFAAMLEKEIKSSRVKKYAKLSKPQKLKNFFKFN